MQFHSEREIRFASLPQQADALRHRIETFRGRIRSLTGRSAGTPLTAYPIVRETLLELSSAVEDLGASEAQLRALAAELTASRAELEVERQRYWKLFHHAPNAYLVTDASGRILESNRAAAEVLGLPESPMEGVMLTAFVSPDQRMALRAFLRRITSGGLSSATSEFCVAGAGGEALPMELSASAAEAADGTLEVGWLLRDLSERNRAEALRRRLASEEAARREAEQAQERFRLIAEVSNDALWEYDWGTDRLQWSDGFTRMFGPHPDGRGGTFESWEVRVHPEDRDRVVAGIRECITRRRRHWSDEYRLRRTDGSYAQVYDRGAFEYDDEGAPLRMIGSVMDTTERRSVEVALQQSEERFRLLWHRSPLPKWVLDPESLAFLDVNQTAIDLYGYSRDEFLSMTVRDLHPAEDLPALEAALSAPLGGGLHKAELRHRTRDGSVIDVAITVQEIEYGERRAVIVAAMDTTAARRAEHQRKEREALYRTLARHFPDGAVFLFDREFRFRVAEGAGLAPAGLSREQLEGNRIDEVFPADVWARIEIPCRAALEGVPVTWEMEFHGRTYLMHTVPVRDGAGEVFAGMATAQDISAQKREQDRQHFLADAGALLTSSTDYDERLASLARLCVPGLADFCMVDLVDADASSRRVEVEHGDPDRQDLVRALRPFPLRLERLQRDTGTPHPDRPVLLSAVTPAMLEEIADDARHLQILRQLDPTSLIAVPLIARGRTLGGITVARSRGAPCYSRADLGLVEALARQAALCLENAWLFRQAQAAARAREEVLATVSHDLRNPIQAILLRLDILLNAVPPSDRTERERNLLLAIQQSAEHMIRLVHDLLDITRIEAGRLPARPRSEAAAPLVAETITMLEPQAAEAEVRIVSRVPDALPRLAADRQRVVQVLSNLIGNAIQAAPRGGTVAVAADPVGGDVRFQVTDTGRGIAEEHLPHVFDRFWQGGHEAGRGAGLGLAIARGIVAAHGGRIWVESERGSGSTFAFTIPQADGSTAATECSVAPAVAPIETFSRTVPPRVEEAVREAPVRRRQDAGKGTATFLSRLLEARRFGWRSGDLAQQLRDQLLTDLYAGRVDAGARLPSVRETARAMGQTKHTVVRAYEALTQEGLVERRDRSGIYVASLERPCGAPLVETGRWLADVLSQACELQIRIPLLSDLVGRWTTGVQLRSTCVETDRDTLAAVCEETRRYFGMEPSTFPADELPRPEPGTLIDGDAIPRPLRESDVLVTTTYFAPAVRRIADALDKPLVIVSAHPDAVEAIRKRVRQQPLTVLCSDRRFGERIRGLVDACDTERVRIVCTDDHAAVEALDRDEPVLQTFAAYEQLGNLGFRLLVPHFPSLSPPCARRLSELIVQLNMEAERP
jgi:PAS domain S-box-containing protein